ncbi:MAG: hypothetical protein ACREBS_05095 [Nitrososphaerales archaeon]
MINPFRLDTNRKRRYSSFSPESIRIPNDPAERDALLKRVYNWASKNTSETRQLGDFKYYWPSTVTKLLTALELSKGSIIALVGLSGIGKSSAQTQIARKLNERIGVGLESNHGSAEACSQRTTKKAVHFKSGRDISRLTMIASSNF